jgi:hypothetical protein
VPDKILARIAERRPERWTSGLVEELLVCGYQLMHRRAVLITAGRIITGTGEPQPAAVVNLVGIALKCIEDDRTQRDVLDYFMRRAALGSGLSHAKHAQERYGRSRKWILDTKYRALKRVVDCLNDSGRDPASTVLGEKADPNSQAA